MESRHLNAADGIRGVAVLIVLSQHLSAMLFPSTAPYISGMGKYGVWLFFVLSAFLLSYKFFYKGFSARELTSYCVGRVIRILPLFAIAVTIYCYAGYYPVEKIPSVIAFDIGFYHMWTIPVEFKFYFVLPVFAFIYFYIFRKLNKSSLFIIFCIFSIAAHQFFFPESKTPSSVEYTSYTTWYLPCFLFGIMAATLYVNRDFNVNEKVSDFIVTAIFIAMIIASPGVLNYLFGVPMTDYLGREFVALSLGWSVVLMLLINGRGVWGKVMRSKVLTYLGKWSFSIYLFHYIIFVEISRNHSYSIPYAVIALASAIAVGAAFYYLVEMNLEKSRHMLMRMMSSQQQTNQ
ncbi:acyltransferase [Enterobacter sp. RHBSTW-00994]|uniref:acyltransferase family protein n=1 Tax=Enterobacter sp. RHBSTW-00994 TaxID=2742676 RepID=UPI0015E9AC8D|nr:acyltransferase [Enterobacter sp. RHBSTW-00994]QLR42155.1 acyltransferase [Enterobacter sp. RHBSTW-00994]